MSKAKTLGIPQFKSTVENSLGWRLWHGINYLIGGITFTLGSIVYFPSLDAKYNGDVLGGWLFTIGSAAFLLADLTEWNHFRYGCLGSDGKFDQEDLDSAFGARF